MVKIGKLVIQWQQNPEHNGHIKTDVSDKMAEITGLKDHVKTLNCPACGNALVKLVSVEVGPKGWQAAVVCSCQARGILNQNGLHFELPTSKEGT